MPHLVRPKFVAFDTNQLGNWCRDRCASNADFRARARRFEEAILNQGIIPLLTWHHFEELLAIENQDTAAARITFLNDLPMVAWVVAADERTALGGVVDILAGELAAALAINAPDACTTCDHAARTMIQVGSGRDAMRPYVEIWGNLQPIFWQRARQTRAHVAIVDSTGFDISDKKVVDLLSGGIRSGENLAAHLRTMQTSLAKEITDRGDKRIRDPDAIANQFMLEVIEIATPSAADARELVLRGLALMDIELSDIAPDTTMSEINALSVFRKQARVAARSAGLNEADARHVPMNTIPSWRISRALSTYKQDQAERKGSNLIDGHLATLAPYADITFVDKRTMETLRRAFARSNEMTKLVRDVRRTTNYFDAPLASRGLAVENKATTV